MSFYDDVMKMERARTGNYGQDAAEYIPPRCPVCKRRDRDYVYKRADGEVVGSEWCIKHDYDREGE